MEALNNILYQQIKDNFYYATFMDFKIIIDKTTGFVNATNLCNIQGKKYKDWYRKPTTQQLFKSLQTKHDVIKYVINGPAISGTYIHEFLILDIALWISPDLYNKCKKIIIGHTTSLSQEQKDKLREHHQNLRCDILETKIKFTEMLSLSDHKNIKSKLLKHLLKQLLDLAKHLEALEFFSKESLDRILFIDGRYGCTANNDKVGEKMKEFILDKIMKNIQNV